MTSYEQAMRELERAKAEVKELLPVYNRYTQAVQRLREAEQAAGLARKRAAGL